MSSCCIRRIFKLAIGYIFYVLPVGAVGYLFLYVNVNSFVCQEMNSPFLFDNTYPPAVSLTQFYQSRIEFFEECDHDSNDYIACEIARRGFSIQ